MPSQIEYGTRPSSQLESHAYMRLRTKIDRSFGASLFGRLRHQGLTLPLPNLVRFGRKASPAGRFLGARYNHSEYAQKLYV